MRPGGGSLHCLHLSHCIFSLNLYIHILKFTFPQIKFAIGKIFCIFAIILTTKAKAAL